MINIAARYKIHLVLLLFMVVATGVNIRKPVHIDDTAYLKMAQAILRNPVRPLSQQINWGDTAEPIFVINQPLLIPFVYVILIKLFGNSVLILHLFIAFCSALAIVFFYLLGNLFQVRHPLFLTGLFALGPSFLPEQNLMVDIPLIASWLVFFWAILTAEEGDMNDLLAGIALSVACMIKYTSLVLLPIFLFTIIYRGHWKRLWFVGIPVVTLLAWSAFNYYDYGAVHLLSRPTPPLTGQVVFYRSVTWIAGLGSVAPFVISFISLKRDDPADRDWLIVSLACSLLLCLFMIVAEQTTFAAYWIPFFAAGVFLNGFAASILIRELAAGWKAKDKNAILLGAVLGLWVTGVSAFIILFSPFIAIRHIFLVIPPFLLLLGRHLVRQGRVVSRDAISFGLTALLGLALALSDYSYADIYRDYAYHIREELPAKARVYQTGHWGWEWYSVNAGMIQYDTVKNRLRKGNYLVIPSYVHNQQIAAEDLPRLQEVQRLHIPAPAMTWIRTMYTDASGGGYYAFQFPQTTPWRFSMAPFEFVIYQVSD